MDMARRMTDLERQLERESLIIGAHALQRENEELRRVVVDLQQELIIVQAEYNRLLQSVTAQMNDELND